VFVRELYADTLAVGGREPQGEASGVRQGERERMVGNPCQRPLEQRRRASVLDDFEVALAVQIELETRGGSAREGGDAQEYGLPRPADQVQRFPRRAQDDFAVGIKGVERGEKMLRGALRNARQPCGESGGDGGGKKCGRACSGDQAGGGRGQQHGGHARHGLKLAGNKPKDKPEPHSRLELGAALRYSEGMKKKPINKDRVAGLVRQLLEELGEDPEREGLKKTPERMAESLIFLTGGYWKTPKQILNGAVFQAHMNHMIIVRDIEIYSLCEHHLLPFYGRCHVGYIAKEKVLGVSKIARIVDCFARRLQIQERLTEQVADAILEEAEAEGVGVVMECRHLCMMMRGVEKQNSVMTTSAVLGSFRTDPATRQEFMTLINR